MHEDQSYTLLIRVLSRLLSGGFITPDRANSDQDIEAYALALIQDLLNVAQLDQIIRAPAIRCQVLMFCAYLQSQEGDNSGAKDSLQQSLKIAETHGLKQITQFAACRACVVCILQGDYQEALDWLNYLEVKLIENGEWVPVDKWEGLRQILENQAQSPGSHLFPGLARLWGFFRRSIRRTERREHELFQWPLPLDISGFSAPFLDSQISLPFQRSPIQSEPPPLSSLKIYYFGQFRVFQNDQLISTWPSGKGKAIIKYMGINPGRPVNKEVLMETFWRDVSPETARNNLNVAMYGLRRAFRSVCDLPVVLFEEGSYRLNPELEVWSDVDEFESRLLTGHKLEKSGRLDLAITEYETVSDLYLGDFLEEDLYEEWTIHTRERLRVAYMELLDRLSRIHFKQEQYVTCIALCQRILERDSCREDAHCRLMRCYCRQGQYHLALRQYQACLDALLNELDLDPSPTTLQLVNRIRQRERV